MHCSMALGRPFLAEATKNALCKCMDEHTLEQARAAHQRQQGVQGSHVLHGRDTIQYTNVWSFASHYCLSLYYITHRNVCACISIAILLALLPLGLTRDR